MRKILAMLLAVVMVWACAPAAEIPQLLPRPPLLQPRHPLPLRMQMMSPMR